MFKNLHDQDHDEVNSLEKKIMKLIWKYLSFEDKLNCKLVCKISNNIISGTDFLDLNLYFPSKIRKIPKITTNHETLIIKSEIWGSFWLGDCKTFEQHSHSMIHLKIVDYVFYPMELNEFLNEFTLLETLKLEIDLSIKSSIDLTKEELTKLLAFKDSKTVIIDDNENALHFEIVINVIAMISRIQWKITTNQNL